MHRLRRPCPSEPWKRRRFFIDADPRAMTESAPTPYRAPWWLPGGHAQTIYARLAARCNAVSYRRTEWTTPDDDIVAIDWVDGPANAPLVVMFHGLEGGSDSHYSRALMSDVAAQGWRGVVPHFRGCGGLPNRKPRAYHSGDTPEIDWMLKRMQEVAGGQPLFVTGISLGGNALLKWLGEQGDQARAIVRAASAVCAPIDLREGGMALERGFSRIYGHYFLVSMRPKALGMLHRFPKLFSAEAVRRARTLRDFDDAVTAPMFGFVDAEEYWRRSSAKPLLNAIRTPTLLINARNDPFQPGDTLPGPAELSASIEAEFTAGGGHVGYVAGRFPGHVHWLPGRIIRFFRDHCV